MKGKINLHVLYSQYIYEKGLGFSHKMYLCHITYLSNISQLQISYMDMYDKNHLLYEYRVPLFI